MGTVGGYAALVARDEQGLLKTGLRRILFRRIILTLGTRLGSCTSAGICYVPVGRDQQSIPSEFPVFSDKSAQRKTWFCGPSLSIYDR